MKVKIVKLIEDTDNHKYDLCNGQVLEAVFMGNGEYLAISTTGDGVFLYSEEIEVVKG